MGASHIRLIAMMWGDVFVCVGRLGEYSAVMQMIPLALHAGGVSSSVFTRSGLTGRRH